MKTRLKHESMTIEKLKKIMKLNNDIKIVVFL